MLVESWLQLNEPHAVQTVLISVYLLINSCCRLSEENGSMAAASAIFFGILQGQLQIACYWATLAQVCASVKYCKPIESKFCDGQFLLLQLRCFSSYCLCLRIYGKLVCIQDVWRPISPFCFFWLAKAQTTGNWNCSQRHQQVLWDQWVPIL